MLFFLFMTSGWVAEKGLGCILETVSFKMLEVTSVMYVDVQRHDVTVIYLWTLS